VSGAPLEARRAAPAQATPTARPPEPKPAAQSPAGAPRPATPARTAPATRVAAPARPAESAPVPPPARPAEPAGPPGPLSIASVQEQWSATLAVIKAKSKNLEAIVKAGHVQAIDGDTIVLGFPYDFHKQKAEEPKNRQMIEEAFSETLRQPLSVRCEIGKAAERKPVALRPKDTRQKAMEDPLVKEVVTRYNARIAEVEDPDSGQ